MYVISAENVGGQPIRGVRAARTGLLGICTECQLRSDYGGSILGLGMAAGIGAKATSGSP
jgi:hypothetical protein